ncbi:ABC transporter ATP-binding protein [Tianweitania sp. BSSL-BM11]|uniref:ABC transporter ATP-binding protein n=1 Tax=Tianweitania aestuarii TaxID=2814886 RepID=A0ABS5RWL9_9HYPH|nr:ABC transporter ATP-binding protein [Tianweitania aestuarii]MBS9721387.1 ABC transporter ATP-binding protein [Tianweitania aestuarii]
MEIELKNLTKSYGATKVVTGLDLSLDKGEMVALLGPSGCGKTTTLRMVAGFVDVTAGEIRLKGRDVTHVPSYKRDCGLVFQNYALFPHLSVFENIAFGLRRRSVRPPELTERVTKVLSMMQLDGLAQRYPSQLSGGQQQRVAVARALVINPAILLLDEPFSNLDAKLRDSTGYELRRIQRDLGLTSIFVTHDQSEAMGIADRIAVMNKGVIEQLGSADEIYNRPATRFIASFIGKANFVPATVISNKEHIVELGGGIRLQLTSQPLPADGTAIDVMMRPEHLAIGNPEDAGLKARLEDVTFQGSTARIRASTETGGDLLIEVPGTSLPTLPSSGSTINLLPDPNSTRAFTK